MLIVAISVLSQEGCRGQFPVVSNQPTATLSPAVPATGLGGPSTQPDAATEAGSAANVTPSPTVDPGDAARIFQAGNRNFDAGNFPAAINDYSLAILSARNYSQAYCKRGNAYLEITDFQSAKSDFTKGLDVEPSNTTCMVGMARTQIQDGNYDAALEYLGAAEKADPKFADTYIYRGLLYRTLDEPRNDFGRALGDFDKYVQLMPENPNGYVQRGSAYFAAKLPNMALADLNIALTLDPANGQAYFVRGQVFAELHQTYASISDLESASSAGVTDTNLYITFGRDYIDIGNFELAVRSLTTAVDREPTNAQAHYLRGLAHYLAGRNFAALLDANSALQDSPDYVDALALRGSIYLSLQRWQDALTDFSRARQIEPTFVEALFGIAQADIGLGRKSDAIDALKLFIAQSPPGAKELAQAQKLLIALETDQAQFTPTAQP